MQKKSHIKGNKYIITMIYESTAAVFPTAKGMFTVKES